MYLPSCLSMILLLPSLGLLLALFFFGQLAFVKACQEFSGVECHAFWIEKGLEDMYTYLRASSSNTTALICSRF
jgi:hypothetical protein